MRPKVRSHQQAVPQIAFRQHGVLTLAQLLEAGMSREAVKRSVRNGRLHRVHRGVYRVGHRAPSVEATYLAAVLACGHGAVLSGAAAAHLLGLVRGAPPPPEVTSMFDRRVRGVLTHRVSRLHRRDVGAYRGIPITTVARTVVDLAGRLSAQGLARACHEAEVRHRVGRDPIRAALARQPRAAGAAKLRGIFDGATPVLLSKLESAFLTQLQRSRLPLPKTNRRTDAR